MLAVVNRYSPMWLALFMAWESSVHEAAERNLPPADFDPGAPTQPLFCEISTLCALRASLRARCGKSVPLLGVLGVLAVQSSFR